MKTCIKCEIEKDLSEFTKNKQSKDGLNVYCKECVKKTTLEKRLKLNPNWKPTKRVDTDAEFSKKVLIRLGYDLNSELSVHTQFLIRHNLVD